MLAIHDQFTRQMRNRLNTTAIGLGFVRLLQDAKRFEEAATTLASLENGVQDAKATKPIQKACKANQSKGDSSVLSFKSLNTGHEFAQSFS
jgi:predicted N-formylglutamate amidohydrolase